MPIQPSPTLSSNGLHGIMWGLGGTTLLLGLDHYWTLNETSGVRADSVTTANLTDNNTVGYSAGVNDNAAAFVAASSESLSRGSFDPPSGDCTISVWVNITTNDANQRGFLGLGTTWASDLYVSLYQFTDKRIRLLAGDTAGGARVVDSLLPAEYLTWHHVLATFVASTRVWTLYLDGDAGNAAAALATTAQTRTATLWLGRYVAAAHLTCSIDEVGIWSRVVTSAERATLYNSGVGKFYPTF